MFCTGIKQRWVFAILCFLGLLHAYAMRICLSIAMTEMIVPVESETTSDESCPAASTVETNSTTDVLTDFGNRFAWNEYIQGLILASFYYGYVVTHLPGGSIAEKYGGKHTFGFGVLFTAIFTLMTPISISLANSTGLMALRIAIGLAQGIIYPAINVLVSNWIPLEERSRAGTLIFSGEALGTIYANSVGGWLLHYFKEWPYVFYFIGTSGIVWYLLWLTLCYNNPREHPFISETESDFLTKRLSEHMQEKPQPIPWPHVLRSKPLWAAIIGMIGFNWSMITMVTYLPKYMSSVLKFSVESNGYLNSLVCICMWFGSFIASWTADFVIGRKYLSTTNTRKMGSIVSLSCSACFVIAASYAGCDQNLVVVMLGIAMGLLGAGYSSVVINTLDLSPNYSGMLMALSNGISAGITGILSPYLISILTPNQTLGEWRLVFWIFFTISVSSTAIFLCLGSAEVEYWNNLKIESMMESKDVNEKSNLDLNVIQIENPAKLSYA